MFTQLGSALQSQANINENAIGRQEEQKTVSW